MQKKAKSKTKNENDRLMGDDILSNVQLPELDGTEEGKALKQMSPEWYKKAQFIYADMIGLSSLPDVGPV